MYKVQQREEGKKISVFDYVIQQNFGVSNFGISKFWFHRTMVKGTAAINANKSIGLISNLGHSEPLTAVP